MFIHSNMPAVRVEELTKSFKGVRAVDAVSFDVSQGEIFSLLGSNGAGKTTTVNMLTTLIRPDAGRAWVGGASLTEPDMIRPNVSVTGQFAALDEELTGRTNLQIIGALAHVRRSERKDLADHLLQQFSLTGVADRPVRTYSGGMKRRLDIAVSLMARPRVLFLDEPTTGIDPENRLEVWGIVRDLASNGTTVFLTTQYLEEAEAIASRAVIMKRGKVIANGTLAELKAILPEATVRIVTQTPHEAAVLVKVLGQRGNTFESFETHRVRYSVAALGRHSYGIFLWHWPIATLLLYVFPQWRDPNVLNVGVVALALTALMTWVSHMWIELPVGDKGFFRSLMPTVKGKPREWVSWVAIVLILLFSAVGTVRAIQTAPAKTLTQILLEQNQGQNTEPAPPKPPLDTTDVAKNDPPDPIREMPDGTRLTAVGDSVMLAAKPALEAQFPGISVDATVSRAMPAGIGIVGTLQSQRALREYVVVGLATNSMVNTDQLDQLLATIGGGRILVLINAHGVRSWIPPTNDVLRQHVDSHSDNVVLVDWDKAASPKCGNALFRRYSSHPARRGRPLRDDSLQRHQRVGETPLRSERRKIMHTLTIRRIYGDSGKPVAGEFRILVDRLWPRGISKTAAALDVWEKEIAPSKDLRSWFGHDPDKFEEFSRRYRSELEASPLTQAFCETVRGALETADVVFLYGAKDDAHNQAVVLARYVQEKLSEA